MEPKMQQTETTETAETAETTTTNAPGRTHGQSNKLTVGQKAAIVVTIILAGLVGAGIGIVFHYPQQVSQFVHQITASFAPAPAAEESEGEKLGEGDVSDKAVDEATVYNSTTRQIAAYKDVKIYSPIAQHDLTGVLFHQASYTTALVVTTKLPEANPEKVSVDHPVRVNNKQTEGDWVDADALHLYRVQDATEMDTSIDVGAKAGTTVYAPVTGTVVLVRDYDLYGYVPDVEIHIQPEGHPELDVVLLHQYDPQVKAGDKVEGGATPLSSVRDIAKDLTDVQLGFFTAADDPGNHSHVQVNNADSPGYREGTLKGAYKVKE